MDPKKRAMAIYILLGFLIFYITTVGLAFHQLISYDNLVNVLFFYTAIYILMMVVNFTSHERGHNEANIGSTEQNPD